MSESYEEEISPDELDAFDFLLRSMQEEGATTVNGFDVLMGRDFARHARQDYQRFERQQREREHRASWRPRHMLRAALPPGTLTKELGDYTVKELFEIEVPIEKLIELRRSFEQGDSGGDQPAP